MCFSATASFVAAGALAPIGAACVPLAQRLGARRWMPLAVTPLVFAVQQALEGVVWLRLGHGASTAELRPVALAYLGFAFAIWPIWMPWCALCLGAGRLLGWQRRLMRGLWGLGALLAVGLWVPLLLQPGLVNPIVRLGSIDYRAQPIWAGPFSHTVLSLLYGLIVVLPLWLHPCRRLRWLAAGLALAFALAQVAYLHAFSSVWCYFSAVLSAMVLWILSAERRDRISTDLHPAAL